MYLRTLCAVLGRKGLLLVALGMFASLILACAEYCLSSLSVALLSPMIGSSSLIPGILAALSPGVVLGALLLVIAARFVCKMVASQSAHVFCCNYPRSVSATSRDMNY